MCLTALCKINSSAHAHTERLCLARGTYADECQTPARDTSCGGITSSAIIWSEGLFKVTDKARKSQFEF